MACRSQGDGMPRFYFDVYENGELTTDDEGVDLKGLREARAQAQTLLPDLARDRLPDGDRQDFTIVVRCREKRIRLLTTMSIRSEWIEPPDGTREGGPQISFIGEAAAG